MPGGALEKKATGKRKKGYIGHAQRKGPPSICTGLVLIWLRNRRLLGREKHKTLGDLTF